MEISSTRATMSKSVGKTHKKTCTLKNKYEKKSATH